MKKVSTKNWIWKIDSEIYNFEFWKLKLIMDLICRAP